MIKKLVVLFLVLSNILIAQSIDTLVIPDNYDELKSKYVKLAEMYIEQKVDLQESIDVLKKEKEEKLAVTKKYDDAIIILSDITNKYEDSINNVIALKKSNQELIDRLKESNKDLVKYDNIRVGFGFKYGKNALSGNTSYTIENNYLLFNKAYGSLELSYPLEIRVGLGIYIN